MHLKFGRIIHLSKFLRLKKFLFAIVLLTLSVTAFSKPPEYYYLKVYHLSSDTQQARLDSFLKDAFVPALHRAGIAKVGVFKKRPDPKDSIMLTYVFFPCASLNAAAAIEQKVAGDAKYLASGKNYIETAYNNLPYARIETILLSSFPGTSFTSPKLTGPRTERVYELRSYESASEKILDNKIKMFTAGGETAIFNGLGFNAVFYGKVVAGSRMPNLMYLTTFENQAERDKHWSAFGSDPAWKKLSAEAQYQNNVSHIDMYMLYPADYSDF